MALIGWSLRDLYGEEIYASSVREHVEAGLRGAKIVYERTMQTLKGERYVQESRSQLDSSGCARLSMSHDKVGPASAARSGKILLVYDEDCPLCDAYCRMVRIQDRVGTLHLVNARGDSDVMKEITRQGLDIDQGMALKVDGVVYYGSDAICALSMMSSRSGAFNRLNHWIFCFSTRARMFYPVLRDYRNLLLRILGRTKINNLGLHINQRF